MSPTGTRPMSHEPFEEWAALASVGALDGEERVRFEAHLAAGCEICEEELRQCADAATILPRGLPDVSVPPSLRGQIMARVTGERPPSQAVAPPVGPSGRRLKSWAGGLVAAGLTGVLVWGLYDTRSTVGRQQASIERLQQELAQQQELTSLISNTDTGVVGLRGTEAAARADGWVVWSPARKRGYLVVHNLPPLSPGKQYQLWVISNQQPKSAGVFDVDSIGHAALVVAGAAERPDLFAVTVEPAGGAPSPGGPVVMKGGQAG